MEELFVGHHINISNGFESSADYAKTIGATVYQIFLSSPQQYKKSSYSDESFVELKSRLEKNKIKIVVHGSYMLNFCNDPNSYIHKKAIDLLISDLNDSVKFDAIGVIIHMGKSLKLDQDTAFNNYVLGIKKVLSDSDQKSVLILETGAGQGSEICTSIFDLSKLYNSFTEQEKNRIKFCIDTCHVYSAGYDIGNQYYVDVFITLIEKYLGWNNVACIHLNDSHCFLNSRKDRHRDITKGYINELGLKKFVNKCFSLNIPVILETPCDEINKKEQIQLVKSWYSLK